MKSFLKRTYEVEGFGTFPFDMLRYDEAKFATPADEARAGEYRKRRVVMLYGREPTVGRWESFTWKVL
jgi:hypothetical protein